MTRREQLGLGRCRLWDELLETPQVRWLELLNDNPSEPEEWQRLARRGGFPTPAVHLNLLESSVHTGHIGDTSVRAHG